MSNCSSISIGISIINKTLILLLLLYNAFVNIFLQSGIRNILIIIAIYLYLF